MFNPHIKAESAASMTKSNTIYLKVEIKTYINNRKKRVLLSEKGFNKKTNPEIMGK